MLVNKNVMSDYAHVFGMVSKYHEAYSKLKYPRNLKLAGAANMIAKAVNTLTQGERVMIPNSQEVTAEESPILGEMVGAFGVGFEWDASGLFYIVWSKADGE